MQERGVMPEPPANRDIVVIGASAGGLEALRVLLTGLPPEFMAAVFVVLHVGEASRLVSVLDQVSPLPVMRAIDGERFEHGHVYVAPPGKHLLLHDHHVLLRRGPRENLARPAIDPLFRSAAASFTTRVIGVVLSGALSDGTAGLRAIKRCGGLAVVQDPREALVPAMPDNALRHVDVNHVLPAADIALLLGTLTQQTAEPAPEVPLNIRLEAAIAAQELADMRVDDMLGTPSRFTCPECHGSLWEIEDGNILRYRCHVGHAFAADAVLTSQAEETDRLLGTLLRSHQERAALAWRVAQKERAEGRHSLAAQFERRAGEYEEDAELVKGLMRNGEVRGRVVTSDNLRSALVHEQEEER
jgi:two-component system chemotaxis response regulator CheB